MLYMYQYILIYNIYFIWYMSFEIWQPVGSHKLNTVLWFSGHLRFFSLTLWTFNWIPLLKGVNDFNLIVIWMLWCLSSYMLNQKQPKTTFYCIIFLVSAPYSQYQIYLCCKVLLFKSLIFHVVICIYFPNI